MSDNLDPIDNNLDGGQNGTQNDTPALELNDELVLNYFKSQGKEVNSIEELFTPKQIEVVKEVNPYEDFLDDEDKQYLSYKKETGRSRKDFEALNKNFDEVNPLDLARERARLETGENLSNEKCDAYLERKLGIDLSDLESMDEFDELNLKAYTKDFREQKKQEQQKYKQPIQKSNDDFIELDNGVMIKKEVYESRKQNHQQFLEEAKASLNGVKESVFTLKIDENGSQREMSFNYEFNDEEKHRMFSDISDIDGIIEKNYRTEKGFNYQQFAEDLFWLNPANRNKAITSILEKANADIVLAFTKRENNVNFNRQSMPNGVAPGTKVVPLKSETQRGFRFNLPNI